MINTFHRSKKALLLADYPTDSIVKKLNSKKNGYILMKVMSSMEINQLENVFPQIDTVIIHSNFKSKDEYIRRCLNHGKEILIIPNDYDLFILNGKATSIDDSLIVAIRPLQIKKYQKFIKRGLDLILSFSMIILFFPILLLFYLIIPLFSKGPAIFKQERVGLSSQPFMMFKFRSMVFNAEINTGPVLAIENDIRITKIGKFIRKTRIDELPQLVNVLKGEMSIIGPRPERAFFVNEYLEKYPNYMYRFSVKPGITGLAQIMGKYSSTTSEKLRFDLMYIQNYSFLLDISILFRTIYSLFQKDKSTGVKMIMNKPIKYSNIKKDSSI